MPTLKPVSVQQSRCIIIPFVPRVCYLTSHAYHIQGCKAEKNPIVRSEAQWTKVKEAMNEGYCDTVGATVGSPSKKIFSQ